MIDDETYQRLQAPGVVALVGDRIFPLTAAETAPVPFIRYMPVSRAQFVADALDQIATPVRSRVQIDAYADTYGVVRQVAEAITIALEGWGSPTEGTVRSVTLYSETTADESTEFQKRYRVSQDWYVIHDH